MIVVEECLMQLFNTFIPEAKYHFGDDKEANAFIKGSNGNSYPLIYQTSNNWRDGVNKRFIETDLVFILAVRNEHTDMYNTNRWATSYRNVLLPLYEKVKAIFTQSKIILSATDYEVTNHPNYSEVETTKAKNKFIDIIDALEVRVTLKITNGCIDTFIKL